MNEQRNEEEATDMRCWRVVAFVCIGYFCLALIFLHGEHRLGGDFAQYIAQAKSITFLGAEKHTGYIYNPFNYIGPPAYPPITSIILSPAYFLAGLDLAALKIPILISVVLCIWMTYVLIRQYENDPVAASVCIIFALTPMVWHFRNFILSEFPYIFLSLLTLYVMSRRDSAVSSQDVSASKWVTYSAFSGILVCIAYSTRSIGIVLLISLVVYDVLQFLNGRRSRYQFVSGIGAAIVAFSMGCFAINAVFSEGGGYEQQLSTALTDQMVSLVLHNGWTYIHSLSGLWAGDQDFVSSYLRRGLTATFLLTLFVGVVLRVWEIVGFRFRFANLQSWLSVLGNIRIHEFYLVGYVAVMLILPFSGGGRYLLPMLPLLLLFSVKACFDVWQWLGLSRSLQPLVVIVVCAALVGQTIIGAEARRTGKIDSVHMSVDMPAAKEMFSFIEKKLPETAVVGFRRPRVMALFGGRCSVAWPDTCPFANTDIGMRTDGSCGFAWPDGSRDPKVRGAQYLQYSGATHIVLFGSLKTPSTIRSEQPNLEASFLRSLNQHSVVFENPRFVVLQLDRRKLPTAPAAWADKNVPTGAACVRAKREFFARSE